MRCPFCGNEDTQVKDSRPTDDNAAIRRRRQCTNCGARFTTFERVQLRELIVVKSNGQREPFEREKLMRSMSISLRKRPVDSERLERVVNGIVRRLESSGENEIQSSAIGEAVMDALSNLDKVAFVRFASVYRNFREAKDFEAFVDKLGDNEWATDIEHMRAALLLAERGLGRVWPNPAVGCVIVDASGHVVGRGFTQPVGKAHAEREALRMAGDAAKGSTAYVTLEPCSHFGRTSPCADALIAAGIARCVVALQDPYPEVNGQGIKRLKDAGIAVDVGLLGAEAAELNRGFFSRLSTGRPMVTLKLATSLDGRIATRSGESQWITGETARAHGHRLRATHDAIMIGSGTAVADDPQLNCRLPGLEERSPIRIVMDGRLRLPVESKLVQTAPNRRTVLITQAGHPASDLDRYRGHDVEIVEAEGIEAALTAIGGLGVTRLLVEGGAVLAASLIKAARVDRLHWFRAPGIIGGDGLASIGEIGLDEVSRMTRFERIGLDSAGGDTVEIYRRKPH